MTSAIEVSQLHKIYRDGWFGSRRFHALKGIDLKVEKGEIFGLLGPNGAGKTTLIKTLLGIVRCNRGEATLLGMKAGSKPARRRIGYLPENMVFPSHHNATRALRYYGRLSGLAESVIRQRSDHLLDVVGLSGRTSELVRKFSKGMRQRLGLAQAMLHEPELLILDEPTDGLDPVGRSDIRRLIMDLKDQGKTVFLNSHILQEVELVCDRVAILAKGMVRGVGTPAELSARFAGALDLRVTMEVAGESDQINELRSELAEEPIAIPGGNWQIRTSVGEQSQIDALVDLIRSKNLSIYHMERKKASLEEVFLTIVGDAEEPQQ